MQVAVREHGWDGDWFRRAYDYDGNPVGSKENEEGRIFAEPQGMCVMAGVGLEDGKAAAALGSVAEHLATPHGIMLLQPAFSRYHVELGEIGSYPPGYKENAGIFCHTNPWVMIAETLVGDGDRAFDYYLRINPSAREELSDVHRCEPYVYAQMIAGARRADARRGEELVADRHRRLEPRRDHAVDPRDPARARRASDRPLPAVGLGRVPRRPAVPRRDLRHHGAGRGRRRLNPRCRRPPDRGNADPACPRGRHRRRDRDDRSLSQAPLVRKLTIRGTWPQRGRANSWIGFSGSGGSRSALPPARNPSRSRTRGFRRTPALGRFGRRGLDQHESVAVGSELVVQRHDQRSADPPSTIASMDRQPRDLRGSRIWASDGQEAGHTRRRPPRRAPVVFAPLPRTPGYPPPARTSRAATR